MVVLSERETVILLHGIGPNVGNMEMIERTLKREGYGTLSMTYPAHDHDIETLASWLDEQPEFRAALDKPDKIHFVTHSMGGLLIRHYLETRRSDIPVEKMGRVVMLGTPHGGSEWADLLHKIPAYKWIFGPAGQQLTTEAQMQNNMQPWYELGIIAGRMEDLGILSKLVMHGDHDGCVSVESTKLEGMKDHIVLPVFHATMGWDREARRQIVQFLSGGKFDHSRKSPSPQPSPP